MPDLMTLLYHDVFRKDPRESGFQDPGAQRYKLAESVFASQLAQLSSMSSEPPELVTSCDDIGKSDTAFSITVDDGGLSYYTIVADLLESAGWRGHCFVTSGQIAERGFLNESQIRELSSRGHVIGTHTVTHPDRISECDWPMLLAEWRSSKARLEEVIGKEVTTGSVPGGYCSQRVIRAASEAGIKVLFTSEPETRAKRVEGVTVLGRFAMRAGRQPESAQRLVRRCRSLMMKEWLEWNAKKALKGALGANYRRVADWAASTAGQKDDE